MVLQRLLACTYLLVVEQGSCRVSAHYGEETESLLHCPHSHLKAARRSVGCVQNINNNDGTGHILLQYNDIFANETNRFHVLRLLPVFPLHLSELMGR